MGRQLEDLRAQLGVLLEWVSAYENALDDIAWDMSWYEDERITAAREALDAGAAYKEKLNVSRTVEEHKENLRKDHDRED